MRWSFSVGSLLGIRIYLHVTLLALVAVIGWYTWTTLDWVMSMAAMALAIVFSAVILLHELGHSVAAHAYGIRVQSITLLPIGGVAAMDTIPEQPSKEFVIAIAGPLVNLLLAAIPVFWLGSWPSWREILSLKDHDLSVSEFFQVMNIRLLLFNLLPGFPMDGGRILRAALAALMDFRRATAIAVWMGRIVALFFVYMGHKFLLLPVIGLFIFLAGTSEYRFASLRVRLRGRTAMDLMNPLRVVLSPRQRLTQVIERAAQHPPEDFAVMEEGRLVGVLSRQIWGEAVLHRFDNPSIGELMDTRFVCVHSFTQLTRLVVDHKMTRLDCFPVMDGDRPVGILNRIDIEKAAAIARPEPASTPPPPPPRSRLTIDLG